MVDPRYERETRNSVPRWVKVTGIVVAVLALLAALMLLVGGNVDGHGPRRHAPPGDSTPSGGSREHAPPPGVHG